MVELLLFLLIKHAVADLLVQTLRPATDKTVYVGKGAHWHAFDHGFLTLLVLLAFVDWKLAIALAVVDYFIHWHIDYFKSTFCRRINITREDVAYWQWQTLDQIAHYLTYYGIVQLVLYLHT